MPRVQRIEREILVDQPKVVYADGLFQTAQVVDYILGVVEVALALRFVLELFGANTSSWFVSGVYGLTAPLMAPFHSVFRSTVSQGATFEWSAIVAMLAYMLLALAVIKLFEVIADRR